MVAIIAAGVLGLGLVSYKQTEPVSTTHSAPVAPVPSPAPVPPPPSTDVETTLAEESSPEEVGEKEASALLTIRSIIRENTDRARFFRTVFSGELRVSMLKVRTGELPPVSSLPATYR